MKTGDSSADGHTPWSAAEKRLCGGYDCRGGEAASAPTLYDPRLFGLLGWGLLFPGAAFSFQHSPINVGNSMLGCSTGASRKATERGKGRPQKDGTLSMQASWAQEVTLAGDIWPLLSLEPLPGAAGCFIRTGQVPFSPGEAVGRWFTGAQQPTSSPPPRFARAQKMRNTIIIIKRTNMLGEKWIISSSSALHPNNK